MPFVVGNYNWMKNTHAIEAYHCLLKAVSLTRMAFQGDKIAWC